jgi:hypothetical protein
MRLPCHPLDASFFELLPCASSALFFPRQVSLADQNCHMTQGPRHVRSCTDNGFGFYYARPVISSRP